MEFLHKHILCLTYFSLSYTHSLSFLHTYSVSLYLHFMSLFNSNTFFLPLLLTQIPSLSFLLTHSLSFLFTHILFLSLSLSHRFCVSQLYMFFVSLTKPDSLFLSHQHTSIHSFCLPLIETDSFCLSYPDYFCLSLPHTLSVSLLPTQILSVSLLLRQILSIFLLLTHILSFLFLHRFFVSFLLTLIMSPSYSDISFMSLSYIQPISLSLTQILCLSYQINSVSLLHISFQPLTQNLRPLSPRMPPRILPLLVGLRSHPHHRGQKYQRPQVSL